MFPPDSLYVLEKSIMLAAHGVPKKYLRPHETDDFARLGNFRKCLLDSRSWKSDTWKINAQSIVSNSEQKLCYSFDLTGLVSDAGV